MQKTIIAVLLTAVFFFICVSGMDAQTSLTLNQAIETSVLDISAALPAGKRLSVNRFDSEAPELSIYIMDELAGALVRGGSFIMIDRLNFEYIQKELEFQLSGYVSDETAQSIGKMLGAEYIVIGSLVDLGTTGRWQLNVVELETARTLTSVLLDLEAGSEYRALVAALKNNQKTADPWRQTASPLKPQTGADFLNRGLAFAMIGDFDTALADFDEAIRLDPNLALAYLQRGKALLARQAKVTGIGDGLADGSVINVEAELRSATADDNRAMADFTRAIALAPGLAAAYRSRGWLYDTTGEHQKAITDYNRAIAIDANNPSAFNNRGLAYSRSGSFAEAIADYTQAIRLKSDNAMAYNNRGNANMNSGNLSNAIADFTQAIRIKPDYAMAFNNRGLAYYRSGSLDRAIADFTQSLNLESDSAGVHYNRGNAYDQKGDYDKAIADYTRTIGLSPNHAEAYNNRGIMYYETGDLDRAISDYTQAIAINPNYADAYNNRAIAYRDKGDTQRALADIETARRLQGQN